MPIHKEESPYDYAIPIQNSTICIEKDQLLIKKDFSRSKVCKKIILRKEKVIGG